MHKINDKNNVNHAWSEMSQLLDKEMPQTKKRKFLWLWLTLLFGFLGGLSILFLNSNNAANTSNDSALIALNEKFNESDSDKQSIGKIDKVDGKENNTASKGNVENESITTSNITTPTTTQSNYTKTATNDAQKAPSTTIQDNYNAKESLLSNENPDGSIAKSGSESTNNSKDFHSKNGNTSIVPSIIAQANNDAKIKELQNEPTARIGSESSNEGNFNNNKNANEQIIVEKENTGSIGIKENIQNRNSIENQITRGDFASIDAKSEMKLPIIGLSFLNVENNIQPVFALSPHKISKSTLALTAGVSYRKNFNAIPSLGLEFDRSLSNSRFGFVVAGAIEYNPIKDFISFDGQSIPTVDTLFLRDESEGTSAETEKKVPIEYENFATLFMKIGGRYSYGRSKFYLGAANAFSFNPIKKSIAASSISNNNSNYSNYGEAIPINNQSYWMLGYFGYDYQLFRNLSVSTNIKVPIYTGNLNIVNFQNGVQYYLGIKYNIKK